MIADPEGHLERGDVAEYGTGEVDELGPDCGQQGHVVAQPADLVIVFGFPAIGGLQVAECSRHPQTLFQEHAEEVVFFVAVGVEAAEDDEAGFFGVRETGAVPKSLGGVSGQFTQLGDSVAQVDAVANMRGQQREAFATGLDPGSLGFDRRQRSYAANSGVSGNASRMAGSVALPIASAERFLNGRPTELLPFERNPCGADSLPSYRSAR